jgi:TIR domain/Sel1 repeat
MAHDVFISHSAKNKTAADAVCATLESEGIRCWIAPRDVTPGLEWGECIIEAIEQSRVMVLLFTAEANESPQIRREVERAVNRGVVILPLRIEEVIPSKALEYFIGNVHWLDALTPPLEGHLRQLAGTVKILVARMDGKVPVPGAIPAGIPAGAAREPAAILDPKKAPSRGEASESAIAAGAAAHPSRPKVPVWAWAGAVALALVLTAIVSIHYASAPRTPAGPPPQTVQEPVTPVGGSIGGEPANPSAISPAEQPPQAKPGHGPASPPAKTQPPTATLESDAMEAKNLMQEKRYAEANPLARKACAGGIMTGCNLLGLLYQNGWGVERDYTQARSLYVEACNGGEVSGCGNLGYMYVNGQGVSRDIARGTALLQKACNGGRPWSCQQLRNLQR